MSSADIPFWRLALAYLVLIPCIGVLVILRLRILRATLVAVVRMTGQLLLVGLFLGLVFELDNAALNLAWLLVMVSMATVGVIHPSRLRLKVLLLPTLGSLLTVTIIVVLYFNSVVVGLADPFAAAYLVPVSGMLLGNSLRGNIVGVSGFYRELRDREEWYRFLVANGASRREALVPFLKDAVQAALAPTLGAMATMGVVALPGMMTGQILGGADPSVAVKYQIAIMLAIFAAVVASTVLVLLLTSARAFDRYGNLRPDLFR